MQEAMNKIVDAEQRAAQIRSQAQNDAKAAQAEAARQGKELLDRARKKGGDQAHAVVAAAQAEAEAYLQESADGAGKKALNLRAQSRDRVLAAARFVTERIVDSV